MKFMNMKSLFAVIAMTMTSSSVVAQQSLTLGTDYLQDVPSTVYEATEMSPQNMDFDMENNMFVAHSGWYNDREIHYYKFRIFAPGTYPDVIVPGGSSADVPLQKVFFVTTTGDFDGVVGSPIIEYHNGVDGTLYSDFMVVTFVEAPEGYVADTFKSVADLVDNGAVKTPTEIVLNMPVVPTGATLQDPIAKGTTTAPILPVPVFYKGQEVWTYVFEVTDQSAAVFFADTRTDDTTAISRQASTDLTAYGIPVVGSFATPTSVSAIPIWHINQFGKGVTVGVNGGGPDPAGYRNIINMDRGDAGYSPLWNVWWGVEMPINYEVDEFSNAIQGTAANGFDFFVTPMYVNCPDIGPIGSEMNPLKATEFETTIDKEEDVEGYVVMGSAPSLIFQPDVEVVFKTDTDVVLGTTTTNIMGAYTYMIPKADIPKDAMMIKAKTVSDETVLRIINIDHGDKMDMDMDMDGTDMDSTGDMDASTTMDDSASASIEFLTGAVTTMLVAVAWAVL